MLDVWTQVVLIYAPTTQINKDRLRLGTKDLYHNGFLHLLFVQHEAVIRIYWEGFVAHDQSAPMILVAMPTFTPINTGCGSFSLRCTLVPGRASCTTWVVVLRFFAARLGDQHFGFVDTHTQGLMKGFAQSRHLA